MSDISTTYAYFSAIDHTGNNTLSGYALSGLPLKFIAELPPNTNKRVTWSFGDGSVSTTLSAEKYYTYPGKYDVNLFVYDCYDNALLSVFNREITIHPYIPTYFPLVSTNSNTSLELQTGKLHQFDIRHFFPPYENISSVFFNVSGSNSNNYFALTANKFSHLQKYYAFREQIYNTSLSAYEYPIIDKIDLETTSVYGKLIDGEVILTPKESDETFYIGTSGHKTVYFSDDAPSGQIIINFHQDKTKQKDFSTGKTINYHNLLNYTLSATVIENESPNKLSITSNGIDGEKTPLNRFNLSDIKFENVKIPFVIKVKDDEWHSIKDFEAIELSAINISLYKSDFITSEDGYIVTTEASTPLETETSLLDTVQWSISSLNTTLSSIDHNGSFRGYIEFDNVIAPIDNVTLSANVTVNNSISSYSLSGTTSTFSLYPKNYYQLSRINEDFDATETFKSLRFQEFLLDDTVLFDDFIYSIYGSISSSPETIGKKLYEKISNYFTNHKDVDRCEISSLISEMKMYDTLYDIYENNLVASPEKLKRILNLISVPKNKLFGETNKFKENFDIKGYSTKEIYGKNLGDQIDFMTYTVNKETPIVALEKFSNTYTLLNTYQIFPTLGDSDDVINDTDALIADVNYLSAVDIFTTATGGALVPRNPNCPLNQLRGITSWGSHGGGSYSGIAITKRHALLAYHIPYNIGDSIKFYDSNGVRYTRTITDTERVSSVDLDVILLNQDLPDSITPSRILSRRSAEEIEESSSVKNIPIIGTEQNNHFTIRDSDGLYEFIANAYWWQGKIPTDPVRLNYYKSLIIGDSGSAHAILSDDELLLYGSTTSGFAGGGVIPSYYLEEIQYNIDLLNANNGVSGTYTIQTADIGASTNTQLKNYSEDWGWPLILPSDYTPDKMEKYYLFFEYNDEYDSSLTNNLLNPNDVIFDAPSSVGLFDNFRKDFIFENILIDTLYDSLSLYRV